MSQARLEEIAAALGGEQSGAGFVARCPAHADNRPSLGLDLAADGRILVRCHAGCAQSAVIAALEGLGFSVHAEQQQPFASPSLARAFSVLPPASPPPPRGIKAPTRGKHIATYRYHDESNTLLFEVLRYEPKGFSQRRPDGNDGWIANLDGVRRVLYHLPEIITADPAEWVYVVEGEKDADVLREHGIVATTAPHGAKKWKDEFSTFLAGRRVVILPDQDEPGREHGEMARLSLASVALEVRVVNVPRGKDIGEWFSLGGTPDDLYKLVALAGPKIWVFEPILSQPRPIKPRYIVESLVPAQGRVVLGGEPKKTRKTFSLISMALCVATGKPFLKRFATLTQGPVLFYSGEEPRWRVRERVDKLCRGAGITDPTTPLLVEGQDVPRIRLDSADHLSILTDTVHHYRPVMTILEPWRRLHDANENDSSEVGPILNQLTELVKTTGTSIVLAHHLTKAGGANGAGLRGSGDLRSWYDVGIFCTRKSSDVMQFEIESRDAEVDPIAFRLQFAKDQNNEEIAWFEEAATGGKPLTTTEDDILAQARKVDSEVYLEVLNHPSKHRTLESLAAAVERRTATVREAVRRLESRDGSRDGTISKAGGGYVISF